MKKIILAAAIIGVFGGAYLVTKNYTNSTLEVGRQEPTVEDRIQTSEAKTDEEDGMKTVEAKDSNSLAAESSSENRAANTPFEDKSSTSPTDVSSSKPEATTSSPVPTENNKSNQNTVPYTNGKSTPASSKSTAAPSPEPIKNTPASKPKPPSAKENPAPDFTLKDLAGNQVSLSDFKGKNVFLNFWATWCPPCRREMPDMEKVYQEYKDKGLVILSVNLREDADTVQSFMKENNYNFKALLDSEGLVGNAYQIRSIPTSYFIDANGNIVAKHIGSMERESMEEYIGLLLK